jgi:hypothetical protein
MSLVDLSDLALRGVSHLGSSACCLAYKAEALFKIPLH